MSATADTTSPAPTDDLDGNGQPPLHGRNGAEHAQIARRLLDRPPPPGYREEWTRFFARPVRDDAGQSTVASILIFRIGLEWLGLPAETCQEVAEPRPVHSLPHRRNAAVRGIVNVRGELLVCVSLSELLGIDSDAVPRTGERIASFRRLVVTGAEGRRTAFEADEVHGLHSFERQDLGPVPATIGKVTTSIVTGVLGWNDRAVGCLDSARLDDLIDRSIA